MKHAPDARSITRPVDLPSNMVSLSYACHLYLLILVRCELAEVTSLWRVITRPLMLPLRSSSTKAPPEMNEWMVWQATILHCKSLQGREQLELMKWILDKYHAPRAGLLSLLTCSFACYYVADTPASKTMHENAFIIIIIINVSYAAFYKHIQCKYTNEWSQTYR